MSAQEKKKKRGTVDSRPASAPAVAPGQALGYYLQQTLLTHRLLSALPGEFLSLELLEDVAVHQAGVPAALIQSTSTAGNNPVSDKDVKLWKTLFNWISTVQELNLDSSRIQFVLYVSSSVGGSIASALSSATDSVSARAALIYARTELWGAAPDFNKRAALSMPLAKFANPVLSTDDRILIPLIINFKLQCGSGSPHTDFLLALGQQISLEETDVEVIAPQMLGWVKQKLEIALEKRHPAIISRDEFFQEMRSFIRRVAYQQMLRCFASRPSGAETEKERLRTYVRQLELIDLDETRVLASITDFLMSVSERVEWADRGIVHPDSFDELDASLREVWSNYCLIADASFPGAPLPRGRSLYGKCMNHQTLVQGMTAPSYFLRGCFHRLADSQEVGWHPKFESLLGGSET